MSNYTNLVFQTIAGITNAISLNTEQREVEENQNISMPLTTLGTIAALGVLYHLHNNRNFFIDRAVAIRNEIGILTETFAALRANGGANAGDIARAIRALYEAGILTEENFRALTAGGGIRIPKIVSELNAIAQLNQAEFNKIIQQIEEQEWAPCLDAVIGLASINRSMPEKQRLSPEMISEIAAYLAPRGAGLPTYEHRAYELAGELSVHKEK